MTQKQSISVVVPILNPGQSLTALLDRLLKWTSEDDEVILVDSGNEEQTKTLVGDRKRVKIIPIDNFTHGGSRNRGAQEAKGDVIVFMTQDATPLDDQWLPKLVEPFSDGSVAAAYSRQVARSGASPMEAHYLMTWFPEKPVSAPRTDESGKMSYDGSTFSNVSSAVRRSILLKHPFDESLIMSEDRQLCRDVIAAGHRVVYANESIVEHSHDYTLHQVFTRYFDSIYAVTQIFPSHGVGLTAKSGLSYSCHEVAYIAKNSPLWIFYYPFYFTAKTMGVIAGHFAKSMPESLLKKFSMHSYHWSSDKNKSK